MKPLVDSVFRYVKLYRCFVARSFSSVLIYRPNALLGGFAAVFWLLTMVVFLQVIYGSVKQIGGWTYNESLLLLGVHEIFFTLTWTVFIKNLRELSSRVNRGSFDTLLLNPVKSWFSSSFCEVSFGDIISLFSSSALFTYALIQLSDSIDISLIFGFIVLFVISVLLSYLLNLILATFSLYMMDASIFIEWLGESSDFSRYPADIYPAFLKTALTWFIPILFFAYIPTAFLLGKIGFEYIAYGAVITVIFTLIARRFWYSALKKYSSASG